MNRIEKVFGAKHVLLPVVHPISREAALEAIRMVQGLGVRGVFLIDQGLPEGEVLQLAREVRARWPRLWLGLNLLSRTPTKTLTTTYNRGLFVDGIWSDDAGIDERQSGAQPAGEQFVATRSAARWEGLYFGGVAFKYQREVASRDLGAAAAAAKPYVDVLCTSGPGTGFAADVEKVRALREGLGDHAMALASGVTPENVQIYMPYVQAFLVGTGLEQRLGVFDPTKIEAMLLAMQRGA